MTPSPEQQEHIRISQRAALRNAQTFNLFTMLVAGGKRADEALKEAESAIDVWGEYEDAHAIEPPPSPAISEILSKFGDMADRLGQRQEEMTPGTEVDNIEPWQFAIVFEEDQGLQVIWLNAEKASQYATLLTLMANRIATAQSPITNPSSPANGGSPK